jgi:hypothetical protein
MRFAVLALLSASLMVNGQEAMPRGNANKRESTTKDKDASIPVGQTVVVVDQRAPQRQEDTHSNQPPSYLRELLAAQNLPNVVLVVVGFIGIVVAICTLKVIGKQVAEMRRQVDLTFGQLRAMHEQITEMSAQTSALERSVKATQDNATAAKESADALVNAERPWISARIRKRIEKIPTVIGGVHTTQLVTFFDFVLTNHGKTPALIKSVRVWAKHSRTVDGDFSEIEEPDYGLATVLAQVRLLAPNEEWVYDNPPPLTLFHLTPDEKGNIQTGMRHYVYWGVVSYIGQFRPDNPHETRFCYTYFPHLENYRPSGPSQYTRYT